MRDSRYSFAMAGNIGILLIKEVYRSMESLT